MNVRDRVVAVRKVKASDLKPSPRNWRTHPDEQREAFRGIISEIGIAGAVLARQLADGTLELIDGHLRMEELGDREIPAVITDLSSKEADKLLTVYDVIGRKAGTDAEKLNALLGSVTFDDAALQSLVGEMHDLLGVFPEPGPIGGGGDEFDATPDEGPTRCQPGDLWVIGGVHRLICGDSTDPATVARLMGGEKPGAVVSDPPYGINIVGKSGTAGNFPGTNAPRYKGAPIAGDDKPFDPSHLLDLAPIVLLWGGNHFADKLPASSKWLVWDKKEGAFQGSSLGDCELAWTNQPGAARLLHHTWQGMYRKGEGERAPREHPTQKPVALMEWCFEQLGLDVGALVLEPYLGSGTTLIAAHRTGRRCYGVELEPRYCDVILRRAEAEGLTVEKIGTSS